MSEDRQVSRWTGSTFPVVGAVAGVVVTAGLVVFAKAAGLGVGDLTRDMTTLCAEAGVRLPPYTGVGSVGNIALWTCGATAALVMAALVPTRTRFLIVFAAFLIFLAADDALSLHEEAGQYLPLPEKGFYVVYAVFAAALALGSLRAVRQRRAPWSELGALVLGGFFLGLSLLVDQLSERQHLLEDGPKVIGACVWLTLPLIHLPALRAAISRTRLEVA